MTEHADPIRAQSSAALDTFGAGGTLRQAVEDRLDALLADVLAERRQAAQEIKRQMERNRLLRDERDSLGEQLQQAIDALREAIDYLENSDLEADALKAKKLRAVLEP